MRKTLILELDLENAAFDEGFGDLEVGMILKSAAARIEQGIFGRDGDPLAPGSDPFILRDTNGHEVGTVRIEEREVSVKP